MPNFIDIYYKIKYYCINLSYGGITLADLHLHSKFSDGSLNINTIAQLANSLNIKHIAVSDHDTLKSALFAMQHPVIGDVMLIPAMELSSFDFYRKRRVHILCYFPNITHALTNFCESMSARRHIAYKKISEKLLEQYPKEVITIAQNLASESETVFKQHLIHALFQLGYTNGIYNDFYAQLFDINKGTMLFNPAYDSVYKVIEIAKRSGAAVVLAHPSVYDSMELCKELALDNLIDGVEINHPRNKYSDKIILQKIAKKYNLIVTGGTDFHGMYSSRVNIPGNFTTDEKNLNSLINLAKKRKQTAKDNA